MAILANLPPIKVFWLQPEVVMAAQVNIPGPILYPIQDIPFDTVSAGDYADCEADMTVLFGSAPGLDDYGRTRLRSTPTSSLLKIGRASQGYEDGQVNIVNDAYVTVLNDFRVFAKISVIDNYIEYKDTDLAVGDLTAEPPPVANTGAPFARTIDPGETTIRVYLDSSTSFAVADGASIASRTWNIKDGSFALGSVATDTAVYVDFPAGFRWVALTVVDDNGKSHTSRVPILADDPDDSLCVPGMQLLNLTRNRAGTTARIRPLQDLPRADYPDGSLVMAFEQRDPAIFGSPDPTDHSGLLFVGWHQRDEAGSAAQEFYLRRDTTLTCVDILGRLDTLPGFHQRLEVPDAEEGLTWGEMPAANMDKFLCYLAHWHSTAASVADFTPSGTGDSYPFVLFDAGGDTLYSQMQRQANRLVPDYDFTTTRYGQLRVVANPQFQDPADRTSTIHASVSAQGWQAIEFDYQRPPRVHTLRGSALLTQDEWLVVDAEKQLLTPVFCVAPGTAPGQGGRDATLGERLAQSQAALNRCIGHHYARLNTRYGNIRVTLNSNADPWDFDPGAGTWVQLLVPADTAPQRGLDFTSVRCLCQEVSIDYAYGEAGTTYRARVVLEPETVGLPAITETKDAALPVGTQPTVTTPPDFGLIEGQQKLAALSRTGMLYTTADYQTGSGSGGPTYAETDLGITDTTCLSFVVDPFSPGYPGHPGSVAGGAVNAWVVGEANVWRVSDLFGTPSAAIVHTFPVAISASSVFQSRTIGASFGRYFPTQSDNPWLLCVSHYADEAGHTGTWATYSVDGGNTWSSEVQITSHYDTDVTGNDPANIPALYMSPRTPGYARTAAYTETYSPAQAAEHETTDWGATWTPVMTPADDDPIERQVLWYAWQDDTTLVETHVGAQATLFGAVTTTGPSVSASFNLNMYPPAAAVRVDVTVKWTWTNIKTGGLTNPSSSITQSEPTFVADLDTHNFSGPSIPGTNSGTFDESFQVTNLPRDFPGNREAAEATPPTATTANAVRWRALLNASATGGNTVGVTIALSVTVTEIELADGTIYTPPQDARVLDPGHRLAGDIHVPWDNNDGETLTFHGKLTRSGTLDYQLYRIEADGATPTDITPTLSARDYGLNAAHFRVRAHDSDRDLVLAAITGNGASADTDDNYQAVGVSEDGGDTWAAIVAATNSTEPYAAAWAGGSTQIIYLYGPPEYMGYSANRGASVDDRSGNLSTFGPAAFIGICGGPSL